MRVLRRMSSLLARLVGAPARTAAALPARDPADELRKALSGLRYLADARRREAAAEADEQAVVVARLVRALLEDEDEEALALLARWDQLQRSAARRAVEARQLARQAEDLRVAADRLGGAVAAEVRRGLGPAWAEQVAELGPKRRLRATGGDPGGSSGAPAGP